MSRHVILHPEDFARLGAGSAKIVDLGGGDTIECDRFGVTELGEGKEIDFPDAPSLHLPMVKLAPPPEHDFASMWARGRIALPSPSVFAIDLAKRLARKLTSLKSKARAQRRLDRTSRARSRKRAAELGRRRPCPV